MAVKPLQGRVRANWRPDPFEDRSRFRRFRRRAFATAFALVLLTILSYHLALLFSHSDTQLVVMGGSAAGAAASRDTVSSEPIPFFAETADEVASLADRMIKLGENPGFLSLTSENQIASSEELARQLAVLSQNSSDTLIMFVAGQGMTSESTAWLSWGTRDPASQQKMRIHDLLNVLHGSQFRVKFLILDSGTITSDAHSGMLVNSFPHHLQNEVSGSESDVHDSGLWVLHSHDFGQQSNTSRLDQRSVFCDAVVAALEGDADADRDRSLTISEVYSFVRKSVARRVAELSGGTRSQVPQLYWGGGVNAAPASSVVLPVPARATRRQRPRMSAQDARIAASYGGIMLPGSASDAVYMTPAGSIVSQVRGAPGGSQLASQAGQSVASSASSVTTAGGKASSQSGKIVQVSGRSSSTAGGSTPTSEAQINQGGGAGDSNRSTGGASAAEIAQLFEETWNLRDQLVSTDWPGQRPIDISPAAWRRLETELLSLEKLLQNGRSIPIQLIANRLKNLKSLLESLSSQDFATAAPNEAETARDSTSEEIGDNPAAAPSTATISPRSPYYEFFRHPRLPKLQPASLGLLELPGLNAPDRQPARTDESGNEITEPLPEAFDRHLAGELNTFAEWLDTVAKAESYVEIRLARQLMDASNLPWPIVREALQCRRLGEPVAARDIRATPWIASDIELADRHRRRGERLLLDGIGRDFTEKARQELQSATSDYRRIGRSLTQIEDARRLRNELLYKIPSYVRWLAGSTPATSVFAPDSKDLLALMKQTGELTSLLDLAVTTVPNNVQTDPDPIEQMTTLTAHLREIQSRIELPLQPRIAQSLVDLPALPGDVARIELLLDTVLLPAQLRSALRAALPVVEAELTDSFDPAIEPTESTRSAPVSQEQWARWLDQARVETQLATLATIDIDRPGSAVMEIRNALGRLEAQFLEASPDLESLSQLWLTFDEFGAALRRHYRNAPAMIRESVERVHNQSDMSPEEQLVVMQGLWRAGALSEPLDVPSIPVNQVRDTIRVANFVILLNLHRERFRVAIDDATPDDVTFLSNWRSQYRLQMGQFPGNPDIPMSVTPRCDIEGPAAVSLAEDRQTELEFTCRYGGTVDTPAWIVLQYDPELLEVDGPPDFPVYAEHTLQQTLQGNAVEAAIERERRRRGLRKVPQEEQPGPEQQSEAVSVLPDLQLETEVSSALYPFHPNPRLMPPAFVLHPGVEQPLMLKVRKLRQSPSGTRLIVKLVTADNYIRQTTHIDMPAPATIGLSVNGTSGSWTETKQGIVLHPFANRDTGYRFFLLNETPRDRNVRLEVLQVLEERTISIPAAALSAAATRRLVSQFAPHNPIVQLPAITLPGNGEPVPVPWVAPGLPEGASASESAEKTDDAASDSTSTDNGNRSPNPVSAARTFEAQSVPANHGLLFVMTDELSNRSTLHRIHTGSQRPRRFLRPKVGYNLDRQRIEIHIRPHNPDAIPPGGVKVSVRFSPALAVEAATQFEDTINSPDFRADLFANVPADKNRVVTVEISVDDYPRAFVYRVPCGEHSVDLPEDKRLFGMRITAPEEFKAYPSPTNEIEVEFEVDAPAGSFQDGKDIVEIGIDRDRDRELLDEFPLRLKTDRQTRVWLSQLSPEGGLSLGTEISDFKLSLPVPSLRNATVNLLGRVIAQGETAWSDPVVVAFDGAPPEFERIILEPGRLITKGTELKTAIYLSPDELSGAKTVEIGFDEAEVGEFKDGNKPLPAKQQPNGSWTARLPTGDLRSGVYNLLLRSTDAVGNVSDYRLVPVRIIEPDQIATQLAQQSNRIIGKVTYGGKLVPGATLTLRSIGKQEGVPESLPPVQANARGLFEFARVPPGRYLLHASGLSRNRIRHAETTVLVRRPPAAPLRVELIAE